MNIDDAAIKSQSKQAYAQWAEQWREHAKHHANHEMHSFQELMGVGVGRAVLCIANGYSFEKNIDIIKKNKYKVDIMVCDKTLGSCLDNGITPTYAVLCDANVSSEKYMNKYKDKLKDVILISNVCGNTTWTDPSIWKRIYFFVNKDVLKSEIEFSQLSGCTNTIVAGTNVSNAMVIALTQCDEKGAKNFFGYDRILLIGYDYCWNESYYAFDETGDGKTNYMRTIVCQSSAGKLAYTSNNLMFSAKWLEKYVRVYKLPVSQCTKDSIIFGELYSDLEKSMNYLHKPEDSAKILSLIEKRAKIAKDLALIESELNNINYDHYLAYLSSK